MTFSLMFFIKTFLSISPKLMLPSTIWLLDYNLGKQDSHQHSTALALASASCILKLANERMQRHLDDDTD